MTDVHSVREYVELQDMVRACEMALELTALYHEDARTLTNPRPFVSTEKELPSAGLL